MPVRLVAQVIDTGAFGRLPKYIQALNDWRPFWRDVFYPRYTELVQQNFATEGELVAGGWPNLSPAYAKWKARHFPGRKIMERTRRLRDSLAHGATGSDTVLEVRPLEMRFGTRVPYARFSIQRRILPPVVKRDWNPIVKEYWRNRLARE